MRGQFCALGGAIQLNAVDHPDHYNAGKIECIDAIKSAVTGLEPFSAFCAGNAIKYIWRHKHKGGPEDIKKAIFYLNLLSEECDSGETS